MRQIHRLFLAFLFFGTSLTAGVRSWKPGDRVFAERKSDIYLYPATVLSAKGSSFEVLFDEGAERKVIPGSQLRPLDLKIGSEVFGRWQQQPYYYFGTVTNLEGNKIHIQYEDGDQEWTTPSFVRIVREKLELHCKAGKKVLVAFGETVTWYPGTLRKIASGRGQVEFQDGSSVWVPVDQIATQTLKAGEPVMGRWQGGTTYYPGKLGAVKDNKVQVLYEDGDKEWTTLDNLVFLLDATQGLGSRGACVKSDGPEPRFPDSTPSPPPPAESEKNSPSPKSI